MLDDEETMVIINNFNRCDRCGALGHSMAQRDDLLLIFCGHHTRMYYDTLLTSGWQITSDEDVRDYLPVGVGTR